MVVRQPPLRTTRPLTRSVGFATVAVPVTLAGHLAGGGCVPDEASVLLGFALLVVAYRLLVARRERSWPVLAGCLGVGQVALHALMSGAATAVPGPAGMAGMAAGPAAHGPLATTHMMIIGHVVAAVALGWFLRQGEQALWSAARRATHRLSPLQRRVRAALARAVARLLPVHASPSTIRVATNGTAQARIRTSGRGTVTAGLNRRGPPGRAGTFACSPA